MLTPAPARFEGPISAFVREYVAPNFPPSDSLAAWAAVLLEYYTGPDPVCLIRGTPRGQQQRDGEGTSFVQVDNAPGIWTYLRCFDAEVDPKDLPELLESGQVPSYGMLSREERIQLNYGFGLPPSDSKALWRKCRLKHCHIAAVKAGAGPITKRQHALRNISPLNHFLFPMPRHHEMSRVDWSEPKNYVDLGESDLVIEWVKWILASEHLSEGALPLYDRFLEAAGAERPTSEPDDYVIRIEQRAAGSPQHPRTPKPNKPRPTRPSRPEDSKVKSWTLNEVQGYYVSTRLSDPLVRIQLSLKKAEGMTEPAGFYELDLESLAADGYVGRRVADGRELFTVKISRDGAGAYHVGGRQDRLMPLAGFQIE